MTELELAYAVTVHKSQGSEFKAVIMPVVNVIPQLCYRNLLYTAVTRAKELMIIVGTKDEVMKMAANDKKTRRYSALKSCCLMMPLPQFSVQRVFKRAEPIFKSKQKTPLGHFKYSRGAFFLDYIRLLLFSF